MRCTMMGTPDMIFGYKGKQGRDAADSPDLTHALKDAPHVAEVYRIGGRRFSNCSVPEAIEARERIAGKKLDWSYKDQNDVWWIGDNGKFASQYPKWKQSDIVESIF